MANIIMVEDDILLADTVRSYLVHESHNVTALHDGLEAQSYILSNQADLIILDWDLPGLTGIEILRDYRTFGGQAPVIMLTGHQSVDDKEQGFDGGADDYLTKPFNLKELGARIKGLLRRTQATIGNVVTVGDIIVDLDTAKVMKAGKAIALVPREYQLVSYLVKNRKQLPTAETLMASVWSADAEMTPENFYTVVRRVAKKLDPDGKALRIDAIMNTLEFKAMSGNTLSMPGATSAESAADAGDPMVGRVLDDKYEIVKAIGGGASGLVYKGRHKTLNATVAIKVLAPQLSTQPELVKRFEREARAAGLLSHRNILIVQDLGLTEEKQPYMVMEYLNGYSLSELLEQNGKLSIQDCLAIISQICQGIGKAHEEGLVHRDLKPGNIMLVADGNKTFTVKIVDFGLAKLIRPEENSENLTRTGAMIGTPSYMSPEQCRSEPTDHRCDIYSIGCMMYEMLTGSKPFEASNIIEIYIKHAQDPPPYLVLSDTNPEVSAKLQKIIHRCLEKNRDLRYQTAQELDDELSTISM
ncbi:MAG TPA: protein kinase [Drouetiella sp.]|jgi:DNA-binding response OmpR family regulator/tRNA A-37 threonylcarbamoyl transferase component Bud32